jgi:hypothetical protein
VNVAGLTSIRHWLDQFPTADEASDIQPGNPKP